MTIAFTQEPVRTLHNVDTTINKQLIEKVDSTLIQRSVIRNLDSLSLESVGIDYIEVEQGPGMSLMSTGVSGGEGYLPDFSQSTPSPNASALIRAINNPVNLATGTISMQAPLYTLDAGSIQIPIALNYQATGIQIGQKASNVGLGWRLSGIGQVTRVVKGFPDEQTGVSSRKSQGWCNGWPFTTEQSIYEWFAYDFWSDKSYYEGSGQLDNEPDIFYFEIPGKSGMFVFDHSGNALTIPYQNISISWVSRSYFQIIDEDGTIYIFGSTSSAKESTRIEFPNENIRDTKTEVIDCTTSWLLNSIESLKGDKITLTYTTGPAIEYTNFSRSYELKNVKSSTSFSETVKTKDGTVTISSPKYLSKITAPTTEITFGINTRPAGTSYKGFSNQYTYLEIRKINVPTSTTYTKRINLNYSTFRNGEPKLTGVDEVVNGVKQNLFSFAYYDETANFPNPHNYTTYIDFWGYWTSSASSSTLRPTINFFRTYWGKYTNFTYLPLTGNMNGLWPSSFVSSNSTLPLPHFSTTGYANQTNDYIIGQPWRMPLGPYYLDNYDYDTFWLDTAGNQEESPYNIAGSNRSANLNCTKAYVLQKITYPTGGYAEYTYEQNEITHKGETPRGPNGTYKVGGLRIKSLKQYDGNSTTTTTYNYGQGVPIRDVRDEYFYTVTLKSLPIPIFNIPTNWTIDASSNAVLSPTDVAGSHVMYPTVEQVNPDGSKVINEFSTPATSVYLCDDRPMYAILQTQYKVAENGPAKVNEKSKNSGYARVKGWVLGFGYQYEKLNSRHYLRGLPIRETVLDPSGNTIKKTDYTYLVGKPKGKVLAYKPARVYRCPVLFVFQYISQPVLPKTIDVTSQKYSPNTMTEYIYTATDYRPKEIINTVIGGGTTSSPYNNYETVTQKIKYSNEYTTPTSYDGEAGGIKILQEKKAVVPIETMTVRNDSIVAAEITTYKSLERPDNSRTPVPFAKYSIPLDKGIPKNAVINSSVNSNSQFLKNSMYEEVSRIDNYDDKVNPVYSTSPFSNDKVYIYGYNGTLPIAEVEIPRDTPSIAFHHEKVTSYMGTFDAVIPENYVPIQIFNQGNFNQNNIKMYCTNVESLYMDILYYDFETGEFIPFDNIELYGGVEEVTIPVSFSENDFHVLLIEQTCTKINSSQFAYYDVLVEQIQEIGEKLSGTYAFHTSFENLNEGTSLAKAKTGIQAKSGTYAINLNGFNPGDYVLSYWKSTDSGASWEKITENMTVTQGMTSKTIGGSYYIDEVRLIPKGALIKTYTYRPDAGKTSETDHNGNTRYWEYDDRGRVVRALDNDRRILETYEYNIKN